MDGQARGMHDCATSRRTVEWDRVSLLSAPGFSEPPAEPHQGPTALSVETTLRNWRRNGS